MVPLKTIKTAPEVHTYMGMSDYTVWCPHGKIFCISSSCSSYYPHYTISLYQDMSYHAYIYLFYFTPKCPISFHLIGFHVRISYSFIPPLSHFFVMPIYCLSTLQIRSTSYFHIPHWHSSLFHISFHQVSSNKTSYLHLHSPFLISCFSIVYFVFHVVFLFHCDAFRPTSSWSSPLLCGWSSAFLSSQTIQIVTQCIISRSVLFFRKLTKISRGCFEVIWSLLNRQVIMCFRFSLNFWHFCGYNVI